MKYKIIVPRFFQIILGLSIALSSVFGKIYHVKAPSLALTDSNRVVVATPTDFDPAKKDGYPFIVMLHGYSGNETQWESDADLQMLSDTHNILLALPDGGYDGWWIDTDLLPGRDYETHIHQELKIWMVQNFNGSMKASQHGILGLSMGGYGAFVQALKHPDSYAAAASLSGVMDITRHPDSWGLKKSLGQYSDNTEKWKANNPLHLSQKVALKTSPALLLICGRDDFAFPENQAMAHQLDLLNYSAQFQEEDGAHTHTFWKTHIATAVEFIVSNFYK